MIKKTKKKKRGLKTLGGSSSPGSLTSDLRPVFDDKPPPCSGGCPNHNAVREMVMILSRAKDQGKAMDQATEEAFYTFMETTPFPSVCGRVCPHPCEGECNRGKKDGAVGINRLERFIGDFGLEKGLKPKKLTEEKKTEKVAVIGSGPGGMSAAYHLARRGYPVTVFEAFPKSGGMLRYGIPDYRLPADILDAEINRICDMGVELKLNCSVGNDITMDQLKEEYKATFVAIGAHKGIQLRIDGEDAPNVYTGTGFLHKMNVGEKVEVGSKVVVIGGGDTAIDAARMSRRLGAEATILYRRTRAEMPAIEEEIVAAEEEGIKIEFLAAPMEIHKENGNATGMKCQRMELGEPDSSGRRRPVPIEGDTFDVDFTCLVAAVSQAPNFEGFDTLIEGKDWIKVDEKFMTRVDGVYSGGDNTNLGLVIDAIAHGRVAASAIHEMVSGDGMPAAFSDTGMVRFDQVKPAHYDPKESAPLKELSVEERLKGLTTEVALTMDDAEAIEEAMRCFSCGSCFECGTCWSFCQDNAIIKPLSPGEKYGCKVSFCTGCKKCAENCPCGVIVMK